MTIMMGLLVGRRADLDPIERPFKYDSRGISISYLGRYLDFSACKQYMYYVQCTIGYIIRASLFQSE